MLIVKNICPAILNHSLRTQTGIFVLQTADLSLERELKEKMFHLLLPLVLYQVHSGLSVSVSLCFSLVSLSHTQSLHYTHHGAMSPQTNIAPVTVGKTSIVLMLWNSDKIRLVAVSLAQAGIWDMDINIQTVLWKGLCCKLYFTFTNCTFFFFFRCKFCKTGLFLKLCKLFFFVITFLSFVFYFKSLEIIFLFFACFWMLPLTLFLVLDYCCSGVFDSISYKHSIWPWTELLWLCHQKWGNW